MRLESSGPEPGTSPLEWYQRENLNNQYMHAKPAVSIDPTITQIADLVNPEQGRQRFNSPDGRSLEFYRVGGQDDYRIGDINGNLLNADSTFLHYPGATSKLEGSKLQAGISTPSESAFLYPGYVEVGTNDGVSYFPRDSAEYKDAAARIQSAHDAIFSRMLSTPALTKELSIRVAQLSELGRRVASGEGSLQDVLLKPRFDLDCAFGSVE